jgi:hypothetical protein
MANPRGLTLNQWADEFEVEDVIEKSDTKLSRRPALRFSVFGYDHTIIEVLAVFDTRLYYLSFAAQTPMTLILRGINESTAACLPAFHSNNWI